MPRPLNHPMFLICAGLFIGHQILQKIGHISLPLLDNHLDCLLCMPMLLTAWLLERRYLVFKNPAHRLSFVEIAGATLILVLLFEWGFPLLSPRFTSDWRDVPAYAAGSILFWKFLNT
ncbi:MAG: hypothetical protein ACKV1O_27825 [Saprospiraceae bacterium]